MSAPQTQHARKRSHSSLGSVISPLARVRTSSAGGTTSINSLQRALHAQEMRTAQSTISSVLPSEDHGTAPSPSRFSANSSDFHLPLRSTTPSNNSPQLVNQASVASSPTVSLSSLNGTRTTGGGNGDSDYNNNVSVSSIPLLRRAAKAAAYANANRYRMRRGSMLGREVARDDASTSSSDADEDMNSSGGVDEHRRAQDRRITADKSPSPNEVLCRAAAASSSSAQTGLGMSMEMEDDMQIETGDVSLESVQLNSRSRPNTPPPSSHRQGKQRSNVEYESLYGLSSSPGALGDQAAPNIFLYPRGAHGRRGAARRGGAAATVRDRSVLRVAASLRDEARPSDSEIASEAKLQRQLGPESDSITPTTPRLAAVGSRSPVVAAKANSGSTFVVADDEDVIFGSDVHGPDPYDGESSSDEEERSASKVNTVTATFGHTPSMTNVAGSETTEEGGAGQAVGIAIPGAAEQHERLWLGFRETTPGSAARASPGAERRLGVQKARVSASSSNGGGHGGVDMQMDNANEGRSTSSFGSAGMSMIAAHRTSVGAPSPGLWGKTNSKRKYDSDRFEPYSTSLHKRRAVSPVVATSAIAGTGSASAGGPSYHRARSSTPTTTGQSPLLTAVMAQQSPLLSMNLSGLIGSGGFSNLPTPTPLSIPSPTLSSSSLRGYIGAGALSKSAPNGYGIGKWNNGVATESPSSTRPSTPTNTALPAFHGAGPSPSLLSSSVGKLLAASSGSGVANPSSSGSGPGYGSGALGLSLGSGSKRYKQEQEEQEEQEDMLDDVNAIKLGEM